MSAIDRAKELTLNEYHVIPIRQDGKPLIRGFMDTTYTPEDAAEWGDKFAGAGVALVCGHNDVVALDFDIDDVKLAGRFRAAINRKYPGVPIRACGGPRFAAIFKAQGDLLDTSNAHSAGFKHSEASPINQIEYLGTKQLTLFGTNRKSNKEYRWFKQRTPLVVRPSELPILDLEGVEKIFSLYEAKIDPAYTKVSDNSFSRKRKQGDAFENARPQKVIPQEREAEILAQAVGDTRDDWLEVGRALNAQYNTSVEGLQLWDDWSQKFRGYESGACRKEWSSMSPDGGTTMATLDFKMKKKEQAAWTNRLVGLAKILHGKTPDECFDFYMNNMVSIRNIDSVTYLNALSPPKELHSWNQHTREYGGHLLKVKDVTPSGQEVVKSVEAYAVWRKRTDRLMCADVDYIPGEDRIVSGHIKDSNEAYLNMYVPPFRKITSESDKLRGFAEHIKYLFSGDGSAKWYINWLAQIVQNPGQKYRVAPLHISTFQGTGRGWLTKLMMEMVGFDNISTSNIGTITNESGFTNFMHNKVLCIIHEVHEAGDKKFQVTSHLKSIISEDYQQVNKKYGSMETHQRVYTRLFLQSNFPDALVLDESDSRLECFINRQLPKSISYYESLYELLEDDGFLDQVYSFLMRYPVDTHALQVSRDTPDRRTVIDSTKSDLAKAFYQFRDLAEFYHDKMLNGFVEKYYQLHFPEKAMAMFNPKEIAALERFTVQNVAMRVIRTKSGEVPLRIKTFKPVQLKDLPYKDLQAGLLKAQQKINRYFNQWTKKIESDKRKEEFSK